MTDVDLIPCSKRVTEAALLVQKAHDGQFRKDGKTPYYTHPLAVAKLVQEYVTDSDDGLLIAALAHDCVEDVDDFDLDEFLNSLYDDSLDNINEKERVKNIILALTKNETLPNRNEKSIDNYERIFKVGRDAAKIKLCDRYHNVSDMNGMTNKFKLRYIAETQFMLGYFAMYRHHIIYIELMKLTDKRMSEISKIITGDTDNV